MKTCNHCEYFDRFNDDCLNRNSPRFQTKAAELACAVFYPDTVARECLSCGARTNESGALPCGH